MMIMIRMYICVCNAISERQVIDAVAQGARAVSDLQATLGVGACCGSCTETAAEYLPGGRYAAPAPAVDLTGLVPAVVLESREVRRRAA